MYYRDMIKAEAEKCGDDSVLTPKNDYRPMPGLDRYDPDALDDDDFNMMSESDRAAAEAALRQRDRTEGILSK